MTPGRSAKAGAVASVIVLAVLASCSSGSTKVSASDRPVGTSTPPTMVLPSATTPVAATATAPAAASPATVAPGMPDPSLIPSGVTLVPHPIAQDGGVYQPGIPIHIDWGGLQAGIQGLAACSIRDPDCDARARFMPGFTGGTGVPVKVEIADLDALVSVRVESVATGTTVVDQVDQAGIPTFTAPADPGDYLVGIDLTGRARTLSYAFLVRVSAQPPSYGATAMTFPVNNP